MPLPSYVTSVIQTLNQAGYEAYVVGGAVRSWLLGAEIHDYDVTTSADPEEVKQVFHGRKIISTGIRHGTVIVLEQGVPVEITTYRTETGYSDHRHPDEVRFTTDLEQDCARRDFTINALCYHPEEGVRDFYGGVEDLQNKKIHAVGDPRVRFEEDALRILRAVRFAAQLGFSIEENTKDALLELQESLAYVSQERITAELLKTLSAPNCGDVLCEYWSILELLIPELSEYSIEQRNRILFSIDRSPCETHVRMAILLSELKDTRKADPILRALKLSNADRTAVLNLLETSSLPLSTRCDLRKAVNRLRVPASMYLDFRCALDPGLSHEQLSDTLAAMERDHDCCSLKQLDISGQDLKRFRLKGPEIAEALNACLLAVMEDRLPNERDDLLEYVRAWKRTQNEDPLEKPER